MDTNRKELILTELDKKQPDWKEQPHDMGRCSDCGWGGPLTSCTRYEETESWEMPHIRYTVFVCPICSLHGDEGLIEETSSSIEEYIDDALMDTLELDAPNDPEKEQLLRLVRRQVEVANAFESGQCAPEGQTYEDWMVEAREVLASQQPEGVH